MACCYFTIKDFNLDFTKPQLSKAIVVDKSIRSQIFIKAIYNYHPLYSR